MARIQQLKAENAGLRVCNSVKIAKPGFFKGKREKLRAWLAQIDLYASSQAITAEKDQMLLISSFLWGKAFDWFEPYVKAHFYPADESTDDEVYWEVFKSYLNFTD